MSGILFFIQGNVRKMSWKICCKETMLYTSFPGYTSVYMYQINN